MQKPNKVYCFFEQSGTFKNEFIKLGIKAEDYDILNDFGQTNHITDLYAEINKAYDGKDSLFDEITPDDLIMAFFPCIRFEAKVPLWFRGECYQMKNYTDIQKLETSMKYQQELTELYLLLSKMVIVCIRKGLRLIIENPYTQPHYLTTNWCIKPKVIDKDRSLNGDEQKKPTQYWFINCDPENNIMVDCQTERKTLFTHDKGGQDTKEGGENQSRKVKRSMINPVYSRWFILTYILQPEEIA